MARKNSQSYCYLQNSRKPGNLTNLCKQLAEYRLFLENNQCCMVEANRVKILAASSVIMGVIFS